MSTIISKPVSLAQSNGTTTFDRGDVSFIIISGALISFMIPGLAFLYAGLVRRKSALSLVWIVFGSNAVVILQWFLLGHSLAFSPSSTNGFVGNFAHVGLRGVMSAPSAISPLIPDLLFAFLQMEFAVVTVGILVGGMAERGRTLPTMVFSFLWVSIVYCPLACWAWNVNGWAFKWGVADFSGGGPVEIGSGVGALALCHILGGRHDRQLGNARPYSVSLVALGTGILWLGWVGFNAGSAFGANLRAVAATVNSFLCAASGGIGWCLLDYRHAKKWSMVGFCCGTISGLIAATSTSGFVQPWASVLIGLVAGVACELATGVKQIFGIDDSLDIFAQHGVGGMIGLLANGFFADSTIIALDGVSHLPGGWVDQNWNLLYKQFAYIAACSGYTFVATCILARCIDNIPGLHLHASPEEEEMGMDEAEIGEYASDFVEVQRDFLDWSSSSKACLGVTTTIPVAPEKIHSYRGGGDAFSLAELNSTEGPISHYVPTSQQHHSIDPNGPPRIHSGRRADMRFAEGPGSSL